MTRNDGLDTARAVAMMVVVATHSAISFMVTPVGWAVQDRSHHIAVDGSVWIIRAFVMPMFFWLSGYFARAIYEHGGVRAFVRHRFARIFTPLVVALVPCSLALTALWAWGREVGGRAEVAASTPKFVASDFPIHLGHLWYLYYLLVFSAVVLVCVPLARRLRLPTARGPVVLAIPAVIILAVFLAVDGIHVDTPIGFVIDLPAAAFMGAFFLWGWLVHASAGELERYARYAWHAVAIAPLLLAPVMIALVHTLDEPTARPPLAAIAGSALFSVAMITAFVGLCARYGKPHPVLRLASESSYWFYVAHFPVVIFLQIAFANLELPAVLKYAAIIVVTTVLCLATYELLIRRTRLRRVLG